MIEGFVALMGGWRATVFALVAVAALAFAGERTLALSACRVDLANEKTKVAEADARAQAAARIESERRDTASSNATQTMTETLGISLPSIEATSHAATERVRTIYRDRPVSAQCVRPAGVLDELNAARARANGAAASGLPAHGAGAGAADSSPGRDGRLGARGAGDRRSGAVEVDRRAGLSFFSQGGWRHPLSAP